MIDINKIVSDILSQFLEEHGLEIYHMEFKKEGKDQILRIYIDKEEGYISTDECEMVSNFLSDELDKLDPINTEYVLEVSSPGMDRELILDEHFNRYIGEIVDCYLDYDMEDGPFKGKRIVTGKLESLEDDMINILVTYDSKAKTRKPGAKVGKNALEEIKYSFKRDNTIVRLAVII